MPVRLGLAAAFVLFALSAARAETVLDLSETASVSARPDEIAASLRAETTAPAPAPAQAAVNRLMARGLDSAHQSQGVTASTGQYSVWLVEPPAAHPDAAPVASPIWHASQTLDLTGRDGPTMLALVGALQGQGMAVQSLAWRLSAEVARTTRAAALRQAVSGLRARAEEAAGLLGLRFASFRTVRLDPEPRVFPMAMRAAAFAPAPNVEQGPIEVSATVTAEAVLTPGQP